MSEEEKKPFTYLTKFDFFLTKANARIAELEQTIKDKEDAAIVALNSAKRRGEIISELEKERDELLNKVIDKFKSEIDHMRQFRTHPEMTTIRYKDVIDILEQFKQQKK